MIRDIMPRRRDTGQSMVEYALILALVALTIVVGLMALGSGSEHTFNTVGNSMEGEAYPSGCEE